MTDGIGVVVIGRNEGERLGRCLASLASGGVPIVYVDSGSTDGSACSASAHADVVELDATEPFTAARARNAGFERLLRAHPEVTLVQFVDGDCEVVPGWLETGARALRSDPTLAAVCGRCRERFRDRTIYNRLCDIEWDAPAGFTRACGGNSMVRASAFLQTGGFDPSVIAGEDDEFCVRLRRAGWRLLRLDADMVIHDAAMTRFGQWWRRAVRAGHCFAQGFAMHGAPPENLWRRKNFGIALSAVAVPVVIVAGAWPTGGLSLLLLAWYPALAIRYYRANRRRGLEARDARAYSLFCLLANFPHAMGQGRYLVSRLKRRPPRIIEYKGAAS